MRQKSLNMIVFSDPNYKDFQKDASTEDIINVD